MLSHKKFKPKKGKKMQEFQSKKGKNSEQIAVDKRPLKSFPRGESKISKSSLSPQSPPAKKSSLKQLFDSRNRNASSKHKSSHLTKESETEMSSEVTLKVKKRKNTTAEMVEELPRKKFKTSEVQNFQRGSPKKSLDEKPDRQAQRNRRKIAKQRSKEEEDRLGQTLFVGNLPMSITRKGLRKLFSEFGIVESVRLRGAIPVRTQIPKKIADITRNFHKGLRSRKAFVVFKDSDATTAALTLNGTLVDDHHIIVDKASGTGQKLYDNKKTIFVGNLPFDVDDESVWNAFAPCGEVEAVRVIRDKTTGAGKGFGYVLFRTEDSKEAAINKEKVKIDGRNIRIKSVEGSKKQKEPNQKNFRRGLALKAKSKSENPQSRKSTTKLLKKEKIQHDKKKIASNFKNFF